MTQRIGLGSVKYHVTDHWDFSTDVLPGKYKVAVIANQTNKIIERREYNNIVLAAGEKHLLAIHKQACGQRFSHRRTLLGEIPIEFPLKGKR